MSLPILPTNPAIATIPAIAPALTEMPTAQAGGAFQTAFADAVSKVESFQNNAQETVDRFLSGEGEELHHVAIASQQAELSFQLFMQVRNKVIAAYQQVMQMQV
jgi:flagellar hook-basal body complex protein FliE